MKTRSLVLVLPLAVLALSGFGCNPFQDAKDKLAQKAGDSIASGILSKATGGDVGINTETGAFTVKDNKTGQTVSIGEDVKLPSDLPSDVYIYGGAKASSVMTNATEKSASLTLTTTDDAQTVLKWYEDKYKGWTEDSNSTLNKIELRTYSKDKVKIVFSVWPDEEQKSTFITLSRQEEKPEPEDTEAAAE